MQHFIDTLYSDPVFYIGVFLAFWAAIGFLTFLRGFLGGLPHLFTYDGDEEFLPNHRRRSIYGAMILTVALGWWELARWIQSIISGSGDAPHFLLVFVLLSPVWIPWLLLGWKKLKSAGGGH